MAKKNNQTNKLALYNLLMSNLNHVGKAIEKNRILKSVKIGLKVQKFEQNTLIFKVLEKIYSC